MNYPKITLSQMLERAARRWPKRTAYVYFGVRISYGEFLDQVNRAAAGLQTLGVRRGDRVALMMPNRPQFPIAYFGALRAGAVVTATSPIYTARETSHQWHDAGANVAIVDRKLAHTVDAVRAGCPELKHVVLTVDREYAPAGYQILKRQLQNQARLIPQPGKPIAWIDLLRLGRRPKSVPTKPADVACLQYTGGTTGTSKGAMLTHRNFVVNCCQATAGLGCRGDGSEISVAALPFFHIYAMTCVMISSIHLGGTVVILPRFELKAALNVVKKYRPTFYHGVPTMYVAFNNAPKVRRYGFHSLRVCMSGGAPLPVEVRQKFEALTGGKLVEGYGLTEAAPVTHVNDPDGEIRDGSIGRPVVDTESRIVDLETGTRELPAGQEGEIVIRGPQVMKGYWNKPEETALVLRNGWLHTGDIARKDNDGFYYIVDRKKDMIIAGGYNIYPREVEEVLFEHPKIKEAVVIGVPDEYRGETVKAFVVVQDGASVTADEIIAFCRERLAAYKAPRIVEFRESLPKSGVGKYLRRALRDEQAGVVQTRSTNQFHHGKTRINTDGHG
jgi:long-chain acyl-CoA synthetase